MNPESADKILDVFTADADSPGMQPPARQKVTDPELLKELNAPEPKQKVTDPDLLRELNGPDEPTAPDTSAFEDIGGRRMGGFLGQIETGLRQRGAGIYQLMSQLGVEHIPVYRNGNIEMMPLSKEDLAQQVKNLNKGEKGGVTGWVGRQVGDPLSFLPMGKMGLGMAGATQAAASAFTAPSEKEDQTIGNRLIQTGIAAPIGFATGKIVGKVGDIISDKLGIGKTTQVTPDSDPFSTLKWTKNFVMDKPNYNTSIDKVALRNAAQQAGIDIKGKTAKEIFGELKDWYGKNVDDIALKQSGGMTAGKAHPIAANFAISEMESNASKKVSDFYREAYNIGDNETVLSGDIKSNLEALIFQMEKEAPQRQLDAKFNSALGNFRALSQQINDLQAQSAPQALSQQLGYTPKPVETVSATWLAKLKKALNQYHVASPEMSTKDVPYKLLGAAVRQEIDKTSPDFQRALKIADEAFADKERIFSNKTLGKFWTAEDSDAWKMVTQRGGNVNQDTVKRANKMVEGIKTVEDLEALREALPAKYYDNIRSAKFFEIMQKAGLDANAIEKDYDVLSKILRKDPKSLATLDAMKTVIEQLNERGVGNMNPAALQQSDNLIQRSLRAIFSAISGHKFYAMKHAMDAVESARQEPSSEIQKRVTNLVKDIKGAGPQKHYVPGAVAKTATKAATTSEGKSIGQ